MKKLKFLYVFLAVIFSVSCSNDDETSNPNPDPEVVTNEDAEIDDFIWKGMNFWYLYKADVPDLANDRFSNDAEYSRFLAGFESPNRLLNDGLVANQDRFSFLTENYIELEQSFSGISKSNGMDFVLGTIGDSDDVFGYVRYILPNTDAEAKGVKRGQFFLTIDGEQLNRSNVQRLLFDSNSYDIGFARLENNTLIPTDTINLSKIEYTENPILINKIIDYKGKKIGYLMYNSFTFGFNEELNDAFGELKNENIEELILDLRYNGGGSVATAVGLAGMITGQFTGDIFLRQTWNDFLQTQFSSGENGEEALIDRFADSIAISNTTNERLNSLNLPKLYVLTTDRTASASELIINSLDPYIEVVQIGTTTTGKFQASATFYDAVNPTPPNPVTFNREDNLNPNHTYAIQPLIFKSENRDGIGDFINGLVPDVPFEENISNLGELGETDEPFLNAALDFIVDGTIPTKRKSNVPFNFVGETKMFQPTYQRMYIDSFTLPNLN